MSNIKSTASFLEQMADVISQQMVQNLKGALTETLERELTASLSKALIESEFHRRLNDEMLGGLKSIYQEISKATRREGAPAPENPSQLFQEASTQLDEILNATEQATEQIMDIVERHQDLQAQSAYMLAGLRKTRKSNPAIQQLIEINDALGQNLIEIMTALSFQDLTGQRIKRIVSALKTIEGTVFELYLSTGLQIKARAESPDADLDTLQQQSRQKVSKLKGPQTEASQESVDELLAQLGLG